MSRRAHEPKLVLGYCTGFNDALRRLHYSERRPPTEADRPPLSVLPMTRAAREALRLSRA